MTNELVLVASSILGMILCIILPPLYDGIHRKVRATLHCRVGPPILQTWYDIIKLFSKQEVLPQGVSKLFLYAPYIAVAYVILASLMTPLVYQETALSFTWDVVLLVYFLSSATILLCLGSMSSGNVFAQEGARRELMVTMLAEFVAILALAAICVRTGAVGITGIYAGARSAHPSVALIIACFVLLVCSYIEGCRLPFELPEAEPEIAGGTLIEYSGRRLALCKLSVLMKQFILVSVTLNVLEPWCSISLLTGVLGLIVKTLLVYLVFALAEPLFGRYRVDMALRILSMLSFVSLLSLVMAVVGV